MLLLGAALIGASLILLGYALDDAMPRVPRPGYDPCIDRVRSASRSRNRF